MPFTCAPPTYTHIIHTTTKSDAVESYLEHLGLSNQVARDALTSRAGVCSNAGIRTSPSLGSTRSPRPMSTPDFSTNTLKHYHDAPEDRRDSASNDADESLYTIDRIIDQR